MAIALVKYLIVTFSADDRLARQAFSQIQWSSFAVDALKTLNESHERLDGHEGHERHERREGQA